MALTSCEAIRPLLSALVDGELSEAERAAAERHLAGCPACRGRLEEYRAIGRALGSLPRPEPPPELRQDIRRRIRGEASERACGAGQEEADIHDRGVAGTDAGEPARC